MSVGGSAGRRTAKGSTFATLGVASALVVAENPDRRELTIVNDDATNAVYLALETVLGTTPVAVAGRGIRLNAAGGSWTTNEFAGRVSGIAAAGTPNVTVAEI